MNLFFFSPSYRALNVQLFGNYSAKNFQNREHGKLETTTSYWEPAFLSSRFSVVNTASVSDLYSIFKYCTTLEMDSPASDSENESNQTDDSEYNYIPGLHLIDEKTEVEEAVGSPEAEEPNVGPYADEPVADEEWLSKYRERKQSHDERLRILQNRLEGNEDVFVGRKQFVL